MIALPVFGVTAADIVLQTADVSGAEALDRRVGTADAVVTFTGGEVWQRADPNDGLATSGAPLAAEGGTPGPARISALLGTQVRAVARLEGNVRLRTTRGVARAQGEEVDLRDPLVRGLAHVVRGRLPARDDEVAVNPLLASRGTALGGVLVLTSGRAFTVVGIVEDAQSREPARVWAMPGALKLPSTQAPPAWFVDAGRPVLWEDVRRLNRAGAAVLSRHVLLHPPSASEIPAEAAFSSGLGESTFAVVGLVVVMALLEVVLLAGPAFAVGARGQSRNLALLAANGATNRQLRRVVLSTGVVLGTAGAATGVALGIAAAAAAVPVAESRSSSFFGPFQVVWWHTTGIALFGLVSAVLAAAVPARLVSRQSVVAVLSGRRGEPRPRPGSPLLGLVLLGVGSAVSGQGAAQGAGGEFVIACGAVVAVLGMIFLIPVFLLGLAWFGKLLPLPLRYALRDATRNRARTVPAVAAVAATVVGVVALGIAASSDAAEYRETYQPMLPMGTGFVSAPGGSGQWLPLADAVARALPSNERVVVRGLPVQRGATNLSYSFEANHRPVSTSFSSILGSSVLVDQAMPPLALGLPAPSQQAAAHVLGQGGAVIFTDIPVSSETVDLQVSRTSPEGTPVQTAQLTAVPALFVATSQARAQAVVAPAVAARLGLTPQVSGLAVKGPISKDAEQNVSEAIAAITEESSLYVERGYRGDRGTATALLVLGLVGAVLMTVGTVTATFLALSDAGPDLATLSAVGASPVSRRLVAASFAAVIGLSGAVLGAVVGLIPGIAVSYPLTDRSGWYQGEATHFLDVPWLLVGAIVLALPLLTGLLVGVSVRSRLPIVARLR
ncbi:MAG: FtsX-like permease family protein [Mycobacteriales bacterium]